MMRAAIRLMLRTALESDGYSVTEAANGREALDAIRTNLPDLMVLDLNMPVLDGMAVLEQMKTLADRQPAARDHLDGIRLDPRRREGDAARSSGFPGKTDHAHGTSPGGPQRARRARTGFRAGGHRRRARRI